MKFLLLFTMAAVSGRAESAEENIFVLSATVREVVTSAESFSRLAEAVKERAASGTMELEPRVLLGLRAHLALNDRDATTAREIVSALRKLPGSAEERAFAGMVTEAQVAAWTPGTSLRRELEARLATLPRTPEAVVLLRRQREKLAGITREELLAEADALGQRLDAAGRFGWRDADQIVRLYHRLANVLPVREEIVGAFDAAIAERE